MGHGVSWIQKEYHRMSDFLRIQIAHAMIYGQS